MHAALAQINPSAFVHNLKQIRKLVPTAKVMAILKANAYGHGLIESARILQHADAFGVARIEEALALRAGGIVKPIILLEGFFNANDLPILVTNNLQTVVHIEEQIEAIEHAQLESQLKVWLKVDTGMHRIGIRESDFSDCYRRLIDCQNVHDDVVLMTHFGCADDLQNDVTHQQINSFQSLTRNLEHARSLANSAGLLGWPQSQGDWVRPGIMLYGVSPLLGRLGSEHGLQPVMTLSSSIIAVRPVKKGEKVGYGGDWQAEKDTHLGVVAIGYGDGYPRHAKSGTPVLINGKRYPLVGRVSMDMITVDLGAVPSVKLGDEVVLWGEELPVEEIAKASDSIAYELLCNITRRVQFQYQ